VFNAKEIDWPVLIIWLCLSVIGLIAIYSATQGPVAEFLPQHIQNNFTKQLLWIGLSLLLLIGVQFIHPRTFIEGSYIFYGISLILMVLTLLFGVEVNGAKSWLNIGPIRLQASEFMKITTIFAVGNYLTNRRNSSAQNMKSALFSVLLIFIPITFLIMQNDMGTALVFISMIPVLLFWSGLPYEISLFMISPAIIGYLTIINITWGIIAAVIITLIIFFMHQNKWVSFASFVLGIVVIAGIHIALVEVLQPHQKARIQAFTNPTFDPQGAGWNVIQAKTAIGSGGVFGKGFLEGTQTQLRFLPEQWTDFIYCVIGEEFGFIGSVTVLLLFLLLFLRLLSLVGRQKNAFSQITIVGFTAILFIHFLINIGSAIAILPVIGLPLPFVSYGGSAFISNTLMLAICINLNLYKRQFSIYS